MPKFKTNSPRSLRVEILILLVLYSSLETLAQNCFTPNGTDRNKGLAEAWYQPCGSGSSVDEYTMCCATNRQSPDTCEKNGLCQHNVTGTPTWRESCTDRTWKSPSCIKLCIEGIDENGSDRSEGDAMVTPCYDGSYCCNSNATSCCEAKQGVWIHNGSATNVNPASATSSTTATSSSSTTATAPVTPGNTESPVTTASPTPPPPHNHTGTTAGGTVVGVAIVALVAGGAYYLFRRKRRRQAAMPEFSAEYNELNADKTPGTERVEMDGTAPRLEMDGGGGGGPELEGDLRHRELE